MKQKCYARIKTQVIDRDSGLILKESPWRHNLVFDAGLNLLAGGLGYAPFFTTCKIGSSNSPVSIASGGVTFTQSGMTITASGSFFTSAMTGAILKYGSGSGGAEQYITYVNPTTATSATSMTVVLGTTGTVWQVQQTGLQAFLYASSTYLTSTGACGTTFSGNTISLQRTFVFPSQATTYTVNEIGYASATQSAGLANGRIVLPSSDSVAPTQYYQVIVQMTFAISPGTPTAVGNVGSGVGTAGTAMMQAWDCTIVQADGTTANNFSAACITDRSQGVGLVLINSAGSLNSSPSPSAPPNYGFSYSLGTCSISNTGQPVGVGYGTATYSVTTAGESIGVLCMGQISTGNCYRSFQQDLTSPIVLPTGSFAGSWSFTNIFSRTLTN